METTITYIAGPLGFAVLKNGKPHGCIINRSPRGWQVSIPKMNPAAAVAGGRLFQGTTVFRTINAAKAAVEKLCQ